MQEGGGSGSLSITENGEYDVKKYAVAIVNVRQETSLRLPYEAFMLEDVLIVVDRSALIAQMLPPYSDISLPYEAFMLDNELTVVDKTALIASVLPPYSDTSLPYEVLMLDNEIMFVAKTDIVQV